MYTFFEVRHPRCVSNKSKCNVYTICRQKNLVGFDDILYTHYILTNVHDN